MSRVPYTTEQIKKMGLVEVDGKLVPVKSLSPAGKVDKIEPSVTTFQQKEIERVGNRLIERAIPHVNQQSEAYLKMKLFAERGIVYVETKESFILPNDEVIYPKYTLNLSPMPAPRMTQSDKWAKRACVMRYFAWRDEFIIECNKVGYNLGESLRVVFIVPMPKTWSKNRKLTMKGQKHQQRPDTDNMLKSVKDAFKVDDGFVWDERGIKVWGEKGQIIIF